MKFHDGERWDFLLAYPASTPIHQGIHKEGAAIGCTPFGRLPLWMDVEAG